MTPDFWTGGGVVGEVVGGVFELVGEAGNEARKRKEKKGKEGACE